MIGQLSLHDQQGYMLIEVIVTFVVATVFVGAIYSLYGVQTQMTGSINSYDNANRLAYNNLRTYANGRPPTWFTCTYVNGSPNSVQLKSSNNPVDGVKSPVIQTVTATAPYGCGGGSSGSGYPIRVVSKVTYGPEGSTVVHATYATY